MNDENDSENIPPKVQCPSNEDTSDIIEAIPGRAALESPLYSEAARREKEGHDTLHVLYECFEKKWNHDRVIAALKTLDCLTEEGWTVYSYDRDIIQKCRERCENDARADDFERRWNKRCRELERAVKKNDMDAVKTLLAASEFRKRDPDEFLLDRAERMLDSETNNKKKMKALIIAAVAIGAIWFLWSSAQHSKQKVFDEKCNDEISKLNALLESFNPIEQISYELDYLRRDAPDILSDPRVYEFNGRLKSLIAENLTRTNEIASLLRELEVLESGDWRNADNATLGKIERVDELLQPHDTTYAKRLLGIKNSVIARSQAKKAEQRLATEQFCFKLIPVLHSLSARIRKDIAGDDIPSLIEKSDAALDKWNSTYAAKAPDLDAKVAEAVDEFAIAQRVRSNALRALSRLATATRALDVIEARTDLMENFSSFDDFASLPKLPYSSEDVMSLLGGNVRMRIRFATDPKERFSGKNVYTIERENKCRLEVLSAGKIKFDPQSAAYKRDKKSIMLSINDDVPMNATVYIMRKDAGNLFLKRAVIAPKGKWGIASRAIMDELVVGEPLFWVRETKDKQ